MEQCIYRNECLTARMNMSSDANFDHPGYRVRDTYLHASRHGSARVTTCKMAAYLKLTEVYIAASGTKKSVYR